MVLVIICGHFLASLQVHQSMLPPRSSCFIPVLACSPPPHDPFFYRAFPLSSPSAMSAVKIDVEPSAFVTASPCFPIKNNRRAFFLGVAGEIISSDPPPRSIFVTRQSRRRRKRGGRTSRSPVPPFLRRWKRELPLIRNRCEFAPEGSFLPKIRSFKVRFA